MLKKTFFSVMASAWVAAGMQASDVAMVSGSQTITGNKTFSGALVSTGTFSAMNSVSLKGYTVDSFAASLLTSTSAGDIRSKLGLGGAAVLNVGSASGTVAAGNDSRLVNAVQQSGAATLSTVTVSGATTLTGPTTLSGDLTQFTTTPEFKHGLHVSGGDGSNLAVRFFPAAGIWSGFDFTSTAGVQRMFIGYGPSNLGAANWNDSAFLAIAQGEFKLTYGAGGILGTPRLKLLGNILALGGNISETVGDTSGGLLTLDASTYTGTMSGNLVFSDSAKGLVFVSGAKFLSDSGSPEAVVTAPVGSLYLRSDGGAGTTLYVKESGTGNTGWAPVVTTSAGDISIVAGEDLSAKAGYLATVTNSSGAARAVLPSSVSNSVANCVIVSGATAGNTAVLRPLVPNVPQYAILSTSANPGDWLVVGDPAVSANKGTVRVMPTAAGTYALIAIALEAGTSGQTIRILPTQLSQVTR